MSKSEFIDWLKYKINDINETISLLESGNLDIGDLDYDETMIGLLIQRDDLEEVMSVALEIE